MGWEAEARVLIEFEEFFFRYWAMLQKSVDSAQGIVADPCFLNTIINVFFSFHFYFVYFKLSFLLFKRVSVCNLKKGFLRATPTKSVCVFQMKLLFAY